MVNFMSRNSQSAQQITRLTTRLLVAGFLLLCLSLLGWLRVQGILRSWDYLWQVDLRPNPYYFLISGIFIGLSFLFLANALFLRAAWAPRWSRIGILLMVAGYFMERFLLTDPAAGNTTPWLTIIWWLLFSGAFFWLTCPTSTHQVNNQPK